MIDGIVIKRNSEPKEDPVRVDLLGEDEVILCILDSEDYFREKKGCITVVIDDLLKAIGFLKEHKHA